MSSTKDFLLQIVVVLVILSSVRADRGYRIILDSCNCTVNTFYAKSCHCHIDKSLNPPKAFIDFQFHHELKNPRFTMYSFVERQNGKEFALFDMKDIDACEILISDAKNAKQIVKLIKSIIDRAGKLPEKCPTDKDLHFVLNHLQIDPEQFPPFVPETKFGFRTNFTEGNDFIFNFQLYGHIVRKLKKEPVEFSLLSKF